MINIDLIVPYRKHTLVQCDEIIRQSINADRSKKPAVIKQNEQMRIHMEWAEACLNEASKRLTKWEEDFVQSVSDQMTMMGYRLSDRQAEILERIYTEKV